ncbi:MAG: hypothetical protein Q7R67_00180 [bacterium]|nr:hypothetical protein [bacterium]
MGPNCPVKIFNDLKTFTEAEHEFGKKNGGQWSQMLHHPRPLGMPIPIPAKSGLIDQREVKVDF